MWVLNKSSAVALYSLLQYIEPCFRNSLKHVLCHRICHTTSNILWFEAWRIWAPKGLWRTTKPLTLDHVVLSVRRLSKCQRRSNSHQYFNPRDVSTGVADGFWTPRPRTENAKYQLQPRGRCKRLRSVPIVDSTRLSIQSADFDAAAFLHIFVVPLVSFRPVLDNMAYFTGSEMARRF